MKLLLFILIPIFLFGQKEIYVDSLHTRTSIGSAWTTTAGNNIATKTMISDSVLVDDVTIEKVSSILRVKDDGITTVKINDDAITSAKIGNSAITTIAILDSNITKPKLSLTVINWIESAGGGTITNNPDDITIESVVAGNDTVIQIKNAAVTTAKIADDAITTTKIVNNAVTTAKIATSAVTANELGADAVTYTKIADGAIRNNHLGNYCVHANEIQNDAVTEAKIIDDAITINKLNIKSSSIPTSSSFVGDIIFNSNTDSEVLGWRCSGTNNWTAFGQVGIRKVIIASSTPKYKGELVTADDGNGTYYIATGTSVGHWVRIATKVDDTSIEFDGSNEISIKNLGVGTGELAANAVTTAKILNANVTEAKIGTGAVTVDKLGASAVTGAKIANYTIGAANLGVGCVTLAKMADNAVDTDAIDDGAVTTAKIAAKAVDTGELEDDAVTTDKLASNAVITGKILNAAVNADKLAANAVTTAKIADANVTTAKINAAAVTDAKLEHGGFTAAAGVTPVSIVTPSRAGQIYHSLAGAGDNSVWISTGTTNTDWVKISN